MPKFKVRVSAVAFGTKGDGMYGNRFILADSEIHALEAVLRALDDYEPFDPSEPISRPE